MGTIKKNDEVPERPPRPRESDLTPGLGQKKFIPMAGGLLLKY